MPHDLVPKPGDWSSMTPIGVCLGLLCLIVIVGVPWLLMRQDKREDEARGKFLAALDKEAVFRNEMLERAERDRVHQWERYEASLREIMQSVRTPGRRGGS